MVLKYKLGECRQSPTQKRCVGINFVLPRQGHVSQMCRHLVVGATCRRHVGDFPSQAQKIWFRQKYVYLTIKNYETHWTFRFKMSNLRN